MSFFGGSKGSTAPDYTGLQLQTSVSTLPLIVLWGRSRVAPNVIWSDGFETHQTQSASSGKGMGGGGSGKGGSGEYTYSAWVMLAIGEGQVSGIPRVWVDAKTVYTDTAGNAAYSQVGLTLLNGADTQGAWGSVGPGTQFAYAGLVYPNVAYLAAANYNLGSAASIPNHTFEIIGNLHGTAPNGIDADPALVIEDFLTNARYGIPGWNASAIDTGTLLSSSAATSTGDSAYQTYCKALGLGLSPCLDSTETASTTLDRWLQLTNSAAVWSGGKLKIIPYGDDVVSSNGVVFTPNTTPIYDLDDDDFVAPGSNADPVEISRTDVYDAYNVQRLEIYDRTNQYKTTTIEARDQNSIEQIGLRVASTITAHEICDASVIAPLSAQLILQRGLYVRNTIKFTLSWEYCLLEPMDLVTVTDSGLGLDKAVYRITSIEEDDSGMLAIEAEEYPAGHATATLYAKQTTSATLPNYAVAPGSVNQPAIFEPPASLTTNGLPELWIVASGGANWGGCAVYVSVDNITYVHVGTINAQGRQGVLSASLPVGSDPDTTDTLAVDFTESAASLISGGQTDADAGRTLLLVDDELIGFTTATLTAPYKYNLTGSLRRGMYGTTIAAHSVGAPVARLDGTQFKYSLPAAYQGQNIWVKLASFNGYGQAQQNLADVTAYEYLINGTAMTVGAPGGITISSTSATQGDGTTILSVIFSWNASAGPLLAGYELEWAVGGGAWQSVKLDANTTSWKLAPAVANSTYTARVRAISQTGYTSPWDTIGTGVNSGGLLTSVPSAPSGLTVTTGTGSLTIAWSAPTDPTILFYRVYYANGADTNFADATLIAAQVAGTSFVWTGIETIGRHYEFWVEAVNAAGASNPAGPVAGVTSYTIDNNAIAGLDFVNLASDLAQPIAGIDALIGAALATVQTTTNTQNAATGSLATRTTTLEAASSAQAASLTSVQTVATGAAAAAASNATDITSLQGSFGSLSGSVSGLTSAYDSLNGTVVALSNSLTTLAATSATYGGAIQTLESVLTGTGGVTSTYGVKVQATGNGKVAITGLELIADVTGSSIQTEILFQASKIGFVDDTLGSSPVFPLLITGGNAYFSGAVYANQLVGGTISGQQVTVQPVDGVGGLTVYDQTGKLWLSSAKGIVPGTISRIDHQTGGQTVSSASFTAIDAAYSNCLITYSFAFSGTPGTTVTLSKLVNGVATNLQSFSANVGWITNAFTDSPGAGTVQYQAHSSSSSVNLSWMSVIEVCR